jgi:hypothetical protein
MNTSSPLLEPAAFASGPDDRLDDPNMTAQADGPPAGALDALLKSRPARTAATSPSPPLPSVVIGELLALADDGCTPLLRYPSQPGSAALRARSVVDLHSAHIGRSVVLSFEGGDPTRPIVMGVLHQAGDQGLEAPGQVQVDADGQRLVVSAKEQLVLQCGAASITLTKAGKVLIQGNYVSSRSSGVNRVHGGSVQLN